MKLEENSKGPIFADIGENRLFIAVRFPISARILPLSEIIADVGIESCRYRHICGKVLKAGL